jgi:hypothetical protein
LPANTSKRRPALLAARVGRDDVDHVFAFAQPRRLPRPRQLGAARALRRQVVDEDLDLADAARGPVVARVDADRHGVADVLPVGEAADHTLITSVDTRPSTAHMPLAFSAPPCPLRTVRHEPSAPCLPVSQRAPRAIAASPSVWPASFSA